MIFECAIENGLETMLSEETFKRFLEVCGNKPMRDYTGADVGHFKALMEQLPESYGKQRYDTRTVQGFVADAKKRKLTRISGSQSKTISPSFPGFGSISFCVILWIAMCSRVAGSLAPSAIKQHP